MIQLAKLNSFLGHKMLMMLLFSVAVMTCTANHLNVSVEVYAGRQYNSGDLVYDGIVDFSNETQPFVLMKLVCAIAFNEKTGYYALSDHYSRIMFHNRTSNTVTGMTGTNTGDTGDGGPAAEAAINYPVALTVDPDGNYLYIAEKAGIIRRVDLLSQIITTVGGSSWRQVKDSDCEPFSTAYFGSITNMYMNESRYMFVADLDARIRLIDLWYDVVSTYAGVIGNRVIQDSATPLREAHFNQPGSLWGNKAGTEMIVYDTAACWFRQIDMVAGTVSIWYDARSTCLRYNDNNEVVGMTAASQSVVTICGKDNAGNLYYIWRQWDTYRALIQRYGPQGQHDTLGSSADRFIVFQGQYWHSVSCIIFEDTLYFVNYAHGTRIIKMSLVNDTATPTPVYPTAAPFYGPTVVAAPSAAPTCYWSGEEDSCGGELEEVSVSSSTSSVDTVTGTTVSTTITRTYRKRT